MSGIPNWAPVETYAHAKACAELFKANRERIVGIVVILPNLATKKVWQIPF